MSSTYSTAEAAALLGVSAQTIQRWVDSGQLRAWKTLGGHRRIDAPGVDAMLHERTANKAPTAVAPQRVLVVDDNPADRELLVLLSRRALPAAEVQQAASGFDALLQIGNAVPSVLVTDLMMPHMNGFEMLAHLAASGPQRPRFIVATSSHAPGELEAFGRLPPGVAFAPKPIERERFTALLREGGGAETAG
jgi:excisionase family DNA binding protein